MSLSFEQNRVHVPAAVVVRAVENAAVVLDTLTGRYFSLDVIGRHAWAVLAESPSLEHAYRTLLRDYDVQPDRLRDDLERLVEQLRSLGLIELAPVRTE
jgi:hypothetical protein